MKEREVLFKRIGEIMDYWAQASTDSLEPESDLLWSDCEEEY